MPSHKIHLKIAIEINRKLKLNLDKLMLGSVLPDLNLENHRNSHYQEMSGYPQYLANPDKFLNSNKVDNPISLGYLLHLLTDRYYNEFVYKNYFIWENSQPVSLILNNNKTVSDRKKFRAFKQHDFWQYDKYLIETEQIIKFKNYDCIDSLPKFSSINFDTKSLKEYINILNTAIDNNKLSIPNKYIYIDGEKLKGYQFTNKQELDKVLQECIVYILKYLKDKMLITGNKFNQKS